MGNVVSGPKTALLLTIPLAIIPVGPLVVVMIGMKLKTRNFSTREPVAEPRSTPIQNPEIDPFCTAIPLRSPEPNIAVISGVGGTFVRPLIVKPSRSRVTPLAVIIKQAPLEPVKVRFLTSLYEPGLSIVWHFSISIDPSCACALAHGAGITAPTTASAIGKSADDLSIIS